MKLLLLLALLFVALEGKSCTCAPPFPNLRGDTAKYNYYIETTHLIFKGRVIAQSDTVLYISPKFPEGFMYTRFTFLVERLYKGEIKTETVDVYDDYSNCRYGFGGTGSFIVYAHKQPKSGKRRHKTKSIYSTSICNPNGTFDIKKEAEIVTYLAR